MGERISATLVQEFHPRRLIARLLSERVSHLVGTGTALER